MFGGSVGGSGPVGASIGRWVTRLVGGRFGASSGQRFVGEGGSVQYLGSVAHSGTNQKTIWLVGQWVGRVRSVRRWVSASVGWWRGSSARRLVGVSHGVRVGFFLH
eukprot:9914110-Karenia_brevis.AAC.1